MVSYKPSQYQEQERAQQTLQKPQSTTYSDYRYLTPEQALQEGLMSQADYDTAQNEQRAEAWKQGVSVTVPDNIKALGPVAILRYKSLSGLVAIGKLTPEQASQQLNDFLSRIPQKRQKPVPSSNQITKEQFDKMTIEQKFGYIRKNVDSLPTQHERDVIIASEAAAQGYVNEYLRGDIRAVGETGLGSFLGLGLNEYAKLAKLKQLYQQSKNDPGLQTAVKEEMVNLATSMKSKQIGFNLGSYLIQQPAVQYATGYGIGKGLGIAATVAPKTVTVIGSALAGQTAGEAYKASKEGRLKEFVMTSIPGFAGGVSGFKSGVEFGTKYIPPQYRPVTLPGIAGKINTKIESSIESSKQMVYKPIWQLRARLMKSRGTVSEYQISQPETIGTEATKTFATTTGGPKKMIELAYESGGKTIGVVEPGPTGTLKEVKIGTSKDVVFVHTTPSYMGKITRVKAGTSEVSGMSQSVLGEGSPHFLAYEKGAPSSGSSTSVSFLPKLKLPRYRLEIAPRESISRLPTEVRTNYEAAGKYIKANPEKRFVAPKAEMGGTEIEFIEPPGTIGIKTYEPAGKLQTWHETPSGKTYATPVDFYKVKFKSVSKAEAVVRDFAITTEELFNPLKSSINTKYYSIPKSSYNFSYSKSSIPSYPSKSSKSSKSSYFSKISIPSYSSYPSKLSLFSYSSYPSYTSIPSIPSYPSIPSIPSYTSYLSRPSYPSRNALPSYSTSYSPSKEEQKKKESDSYNVYAKKDATKKSHYINVGSNLPLAQALGIGAKAVDETVSRNFIIKKSKRPARPVSEFSGYWNQLQHKYRPPKKRVSGSYIEKSTFAIDSQGEHEGITVEGWKAARNKRKRKKRFMI